VFENFFRARKGLAQAHMGGVALGKEACFESQRNLLSAGQALEHRQTPAADSGISPQWSRSGEKTSCQGWLR
jgi:hypothetical protein